MRLKNLISFYIFPEIFRPFIPVLILLLNFYSANGQSKADSLRSKLQYVSDVKEKADILNSLALEIKNSDRNMAYRYCRQALQISTQEEYLQGTGISQSNLGLLYYLDNKNDSAELWLSRAERILLKSGDSSSIARNFNRLGAAYYSGGHIKSAAEKYQVAVNYSDNSLVRANAFNNLGMISRELGDIGQAFEYHSKALALYEMIGDNAYTSKTLSKISSCYQEKKEYHKALETSEEALKVGLKSGDADCIAQAYSGLGIAYSRLGNPQKATGCIIQAAELFKKSGYYKEYALQLVNLADLLKVQKNPSQALNRYNEAEKIFIQLSDNQSLSALYNNLGHFYSDRDKKTAVTYFEKAIALAKFTSEKNFKVIIARNLSSLYESLGNMEKALEYRKLYDTYKEDISAVAENVKYMELDQQLQVSKKEKQLQIKDNELNQLHSSRLYIYLIVSILMAVSAITLLLYRKRIRNQQKLEASIQSVSLQIESLKSENTVLKEKLLSTETELVSLENKYSGKKEELPENLVSLSKREYEVLLFIAEGLTDKEIAEKIFVSVNTVRTHTRRIYDKLLVNSRVEAISMLNKYKLTPEALQ